MTPNRICVGEAFRGAPLLRLPLRLAEAVSLSASSGVASWSPRWGGDAARAVLIFQTTHLSRDSPRGVSFVLPMRFRGQRAAFPAPSARRRKTCR